jgi:hypothetical protein
MRDFSALSESAAKLLLHFLDADGETQEPEQAQRLAGVSRASYFRARNQLVERGYLDKRGNLLWRPQSAPARLEMTNGTAIESAPTPKPLRATTPPPSVLVESEPDESLPIRQRAMQADLMDDSGDWSSSNSPRRKRRLAQIKVVQDAWRELGLPGDLGADNAKDFLGWNDDSAEQVLEAFTDLKRRADTGFVKSPLTWLRSKYQRRAKEEVARPQVRQADISAPSGGDAVEEGTMLSDWTPETRRKMARLEKLGLLRTRSEDE